MIAAAPRSSAHSRAPFALLRPAAALLVAAPAAYFLWVKLASYAHFDPAAYRRYWMVRWWLVSHILGGATALCIGPLQFWPALRRRNIRLHRILGRVYLGSIAVGSVGGFYMAAFHAGGGFGFSLAFLDLAWALTASMALVAIRHRQIALHREWMVRSYVVTYGFVLFRILQYSHVLHGLGREEAAAAGWACWAPPLLVTEVVLQWRRLIAGPPAAERRQTSTPVG